MDAAAISAGKLLPYLLLTLNHWQLTRSCQLPPFSVIRNSPTARARGCNEKKRKEHNDDEYDDEYDDTDVSSTDNADMQRHIPLPKDKKRGAECKLEDVKDQRAP